MKSIKLMSSKAVTLTELLVVLAIVSLLATIAVPVYVNQMQRARVATAQYETKQIAEALQAVAITHGYLVPIHVLDNVPNSDGSGVGGSTASRDDFDNMSNLTARFVIDVTKPLDQQRNAQQNNLGQSTTVPAIERLIETWQGPFLNPKRVRYVGEDLSANTFGDLTQDLVVDPWGNPYLVYSDYGQAASATIDDFEGQDIVLGMDDLQLATDFEDDRFDRFAVVSFGPDGQSIFNSTSNPLIEGDDISYAFSVMASNESRYQFY